MGNSLIKIDFTKPRILQLDSELSLRDIYRRLVEIGGLSSGTPFRDWVKEKLKYYQECRDFRVILRESSGGRRAKDYIATMQVAMEICANGHGEAGHEMRRFMSECVRLVNDTNPASLPLEVQALQQVVNSLASQHQRLALVEADNDASPMTADQVEQIDDLIHQKVKEHRHGIVAGLIQRDIKQAFFKYPGKRTYKEVPKRHFEDVRRLILDWHPTLVQERRIQERIASGKR